ncbi:MAG: hypothetical protein JWN44_6805 [Myxococcales bacterium]|nr:hypothetical protein [Myxococcales bacterium]
MPFTVTQRKRGGFEYTSLAETQSAALVLAQMMRRAGDEYCAESAVTVQSSNGAIISAWRGGTYGWQPVPQARPAASETGLQPLHSPRPPGPAPKRSNRFARLPTDAMQSQSQVSMSRSYGSISITDYSAVSVA